MKKTVIALTLILALSLLAFAGAAEVPSATHNSWMTKAPMHEARAHLGVSVVNEKIYAIGGDAGSEVGNVIPGWGHTYNVLSTNEEYNTATDVWTLKAPMPTSRALFGIAVYQDKIYCIGGYRALVTYNDERIEKVSYFDTGANEAYAPATDTWETKASMPTPRHSVKANIVNNKIYVVDDVLNQVYDPVNDTWVLKTPPPYEITSYSSAVVDDQIYFICARTNSSGSRTGAFFQIYNPQYDSWSIGAETPTYGVGIGLGATTGLKAPQQICFFEETTTYNYDIKNDSWIVSSPMLTSRLIVGVAVVNDLLYVIGGRSGQRGYITMMYPSTVNERFTPIGYGTVAEQPSTPEPPLALAVTVASGVSIVAVFTCILIYFRKKHHLKTRPQFRHFPCELYETTIPKSSWR
jgi:hypothetical protein